MSSHYSDRYHAFTGVCLIGFSLLLVFSGCAAALQNPGSDSINTLQGMQHLYLRAPVEKYYTAYVSDANSAINPKSLNLPFLSKGSNQRIYTNIALVKQDIANNPALNAFLSDKTLGGQIQQILGQTILYADEDARPFQGISSYNELNTAFAAKRNIALRNNKPEPPQAGAPSSNAKQGKFDPKKSSLADLINEGEKSAIQDFTVLVGVSPDGSRASLYVMGDLPRRSNADTPSNLSVIGIQYASGDVDQAGNDVSSNNVLVDKEELPIASDQSQFFCYVYPLLTPPQGVQTNLLVNYWASPWYSLQHGIALEWSHKQSRETVNGWDAAPLTRVERYNPRTDTHYLMVSFGQPGDSIKQIEREVFVQVRKNKFKK